MGDQHLGFWKGTFKMTARLLLRFTSQVHHFCSLDRVAGGTSTHTSSRDHKDGWWTLSILSLWLLIHPSASGVFKVVRKTGSIPLTCKTKKNLKCTRFLQAHRTSPKQKDGWREKLSYPLPRMKKTLSETFILFWFSTFKAFWQKKVLKEMIFCGFNNNKSSLEQNGLKIIDGKHLGTLEGHSKVKRGY